VQVLTEGLQQKPVPLLYDSRAKNRECIGAGFKSHFHPQKRLLQINFIKSLCACTAENNYVMALLYG